MMPQTIVAVEWSGSAARFDRRMEGFVMSRCRELRHSQVGEEAAGGNHCRGELQMSSRKRRIALMARIGLGLFALAVPGATAVGQEIEIAVPNALENVEGDTWGGIPYAGTTIYQEVIPASEFQSLPETHRVITGYFLRPDKQVTHPLTASIQSLVIRLSTTSKSPFDIDTVFDNNVGDDVVTVHDGPWTGSTQATGPPEGPRGFDYFVPFQVPFVYDHTSGRNLVLEATEVNSSERLGDVTTTAHPRAVWGTSRTAPGQLDNIAGVFQFIFVPEPSPGDFNADGVLDVRDIDLLSAQLRKPSPSKWFDVTGDSLVDMNDVTFWLKDLKKSWIGDADVNLEFNSSDFVQVFTVGKYETEQPAVWSEGDWDASGTFESGDFVVAFQDGGYEQGPRTDVTAVPEPAAWTLLVIGLPLWLIGRRTRRAA